MIAARAKGASVREYSFSSIKQDAFGDTGSNGPSADDSPAIDLVHLARQTHGDAALERELLAMFDTQAAKLLARLALRDVGAQAKADIAHRLKGSALALGAWRVAEAATATETHFAHTAVGAFSGPDPLIELQAAVDAARAAIAGLIA